MELIGIQGLQLCHELCGHFGIQQNGKKWTMQVNEPRSASLSAMSMFEGLEPPEIFKKSLEAFYCCQTHHLSFRQNDKLDNVWRDDLARG